MTAGRHQRAAHLSAVRAAGEDARPALPVDGHPVAMVRWRQGAGRVPRVDARGQTHASIDDYPSATEVFPGVEAQGGVCYFLWDRDNDGDCAVSQRIQGRADSTSRRPLLEDGRTTFSFAFNEGLSILKKVVASKRRATLSSRCSQPRVRSTGQFGRPFGLRRISEARSVEGAT